MLEKVMIIQCDCANGTADASLGSAAVGLQVHYGPALGVRGKGSPEGFQG